MMAAARDFIASWHKDGLSVALVVRTIRTVKHELDQVHSEKESKASEDEGQKRLAQKSEGVMSILDQVSLSRLTNGELKIATCLGRSQPATDRSQ